VHPIPAVLRRSLPPPDEGAPTMGAQSAIVALGPQPVWRRGAHACVCFREAAADVLSDSAPDPFGMIPEFSDRAV
jgi:hypothetical protein